MPRAAVKDKEESTASARTARRSTVRAPRKTAAKRASSRAEDKEVEQEVETKRKAPTRISEEKPKTKREKSLYVSGALFGIGFLAAALIGYSDKGQINPASVIAERNARLTAGIMDSNEGGVSANKIIPVQDTSGVVNGGLVPSANQTSQAPKNPPAEEIVASSTEEVSSSTEDITDPEGETEEAVVDESDIVSESDNQDVVE